MTRLAEVRSGRRWLRLSPDGPPPKVVETDAIEVRGLETGGRIRIGRTDLVADIKGGVVLDVQRDETLAGHVGLAEVVVDGARAGDVELVPGKISEAQYAILRADLQRVWTDLVLDPTGAASVRAGPPSAVELWHRIDRSVHDILAVPREDLVVGTSVSRIERVRTRRQLQPSVVRAGVGGRGALVRTLERSTANPENNLVSVVLSGLLQHARRDPDAGDLVRRLAELLRHPVLTGPPTPVRRVTWGMRSDPRYRQVLAVLATLNRPELEATEGPGELRLGVPALPRLYEYWVYLQVLHAALRRYGPPLGTGFADLAVQLPGVRRRLELPRGTTVTFPGPVHVAFEPVITSRGDGWMGLEYVPHPDEQLFQATATPDVVVLRGGDRPWATVIDAKYVGRHWVEAAAAAIHGKYARMRLAGVPVVRNVLAAHPHQGLSAQWAGYGHIDMVPGTEPRELPLPLAAPAVVSGAVG